MDDTFVKSCVICNTEKPIEKFFEKVSHSQSCIFKVMKRYYNIKDEKLQQRRDKYAPIKEFESRLKALGENLSVFNLAS